MIQPLVWVCLLMLAALWKKKRRSRLLIYGFICLYFFSNEFIFNEVSLLYESAPISIAKQDIKYDAAIILGGLSNYNRKHQQLEFHGSADRLNDVLPLYFSGKVKRLIISGGSGRMVNREEESPHLKAYLLKIGVSEKDIHIEDHSRNTYENAKYTKELIDKEGFSGPFLLSTSAAHMPRSLACFHKQEVDVEAFPVDYFGKSREFNPDRLFTPKAHILSKWDWMIHEWVGWLFYKVAGYC